MVGQNIINILLVDDDEVDIQSVQRVLKKCTLPIELRIARNGLEALETLYGKDSMGQQSLNQVIILDINMPKMNGIEFLQQLHLHGGYNMAKIIVLTTSKYDKTRIKATECNVDKYLLKPIKIKELMEVCKPLLGEQRDTNGYAKNE